MQEHFLSLSAVLNGLLFTDNSLACFSFTLISVPSLINAELGQPFAGAFFTWVHMKQLSEVPEEIKLSMFTKKKTVPEEDLVKYYLMMHLSGSYTKT